MLKQQQMQQTLKQQQIERQMHQKMLKQHLRQHKPKLRLQQMLQQIWLKLGRMYNQISKQWRHGQQQMIMRNKR
jgi:hypothetical protein